MSCSSENGTGENAESKGRGQDIEEIDAAAKCPGHALCKPGRHSCSRFSPLNRLRKAHAMPPGDYETV